MLGDSNLQLLPALLHLPDLEASHFLPFSPPINAPEQPAFLAVLVQVDQLLPFVDQTSCRGSSAGRWAHNLQKGQPFMSNSTGSSPSRNTPPGGSAMVFGAPNGQFEATGRWDLIQKRQLRKGAAIEHLSWEIK